MTLLGLTLVTTTFAQTSETSIKILDNDTVLISPLDDVNSISSKERPLTTTEAFYRKIWGKKGYFNFSFNMMKMSSDNLPTVGGTYSAEYDDKFGFGLQTGTVFNFHKRPVGKVFFFGLDYMWIDLNANKYVHTYPGANYKMGDTKPYHMPWNYEKWTFDYGMSIGPSVTIYPFTTMRQKPADNIRLQLYFRAGYSIGGLLFTNVKRPDESTENNQLAWGHGFYTTFGANLTWKSIGIGYEIRNNPKNKVKCVSSAFEEADPVELKQTTGRVYLQLRFK